MSRKLNFVILIVVLFSLIWPVSAQTPIPPVLVAPTGIDPMLGTNAENCAAYLALFEGKVAGTAFGSQMCQFADMLRRWANNPDVVEKDLWVVHMRDLGPQAQELGFLPKGWDNWVWSDYSTDQGNLKFLLDYLVALKSESLVDAQYFAQVTDVLDNDQVTVAIVEEWFLTADISVSMANHILLVSRNGMEHGNENGVLTAVRTEFYCPAWDRLVPDMALIIEHCSFVSHYWNGIHMEDSDPTIEVTRRWFANGWYNETSEPWPKGQPLG